MEAVIDIFVRKIVFLTTERIMGDYFIENLALPWS